jgi:hypothetical protein
LPEQFQKFATFGRFGLIRIREFGCVDQSDTRRDLQAACSADDEIALGTSGFDRVDQDPRIACGKMDRADNDIVAAEKRGQVILVKDVAFLGRDVRQLRDLLGMAGNGRDVMAAIGEFLENAGARVTRGADKGNRYDGFLSSQGMGETVPGRSLLGALCKAHNRRLAASNIL